MNKQFLTAQQLTEIQQLIVFLDRLTVAPDDVKLYDASELLGTVRLANGSKHRHVFYYPAPEES
jgi:hypothetical protein